MFSWTHPREKRILKQKRRKRYTKTRTFKKPGGELKKGAIPDSNVEFKRKEQGLDR